MKEIALSNGKIALVDDEDYDYLSQWKWCYDGNYATRSVWNGKIKRKKKIYMHRALIVPIKGLEVDHINRNKLDNQRCNLRVCSSQENQLNKLKNKNRVYPKGVYWCNKKRRYRVRGTFEKRTKHIGDFIDILDAAKAYDKWAENNHGEFALTNKMLGLY
jgi:hypothetical protein